MPEISLIDFYVACSIALMLCKRSVPPKQSAGFAYKNRLQTGNMHKRWVLQAFKRRAEVRMSVFCSLLLLILKLLVKVNLKSDKNIYI